MPVAVLVKVAVGGTIVLVRVLVYVAVLVRVYVDEGTANVAVRLGVRVGVVAAPSSRILSIISV